MAFGEAAVSPAARGPWHSTTEWSSSVPFVTALSQATLDTSVPFWDKNSSAQFVMMTRALTPGSRDGGLYVSITAKPSPDWYMPHGRNVSHLLCAYKLWANGVPLGVGPGRNVGGAINVDTYNLTSFIAATTPIRTATEASPEVVVAVELYYLQQQQPRAIDDYGGLLVHAHDGRGGILADGPEGWRSFDGKLHFDGPWYGVSWLCARVPHCLCDTPGPLTAPPWSTTWSAIIL